MGTRAGAGKWATELGSAAPTDIMRVVKGPKGHWWKKAKKRKRVAKQNVK